MKSSSGWKNNGNGTNTSRFEGLPGGYRYYDGYFDFVGDYGYWWSSSKANTDRAWSRALDDGRNALVQRGDDGKRSGLSVRCIKD